MAGAVRYVRKRGNTFQYERRVPTQIVLDAAAWRDHFCNKKLWRRSLRTNDQAEMYASAEAAHADYERRKLAALQQIGGLPAECTQSSVLAPLRLRRRITQYDLDMLEENTRTAEVRDLSQLYLRADGNEESAEIFADLVERYEQDAADRRLAITTPGFEDLSRPWLPSPVRSARDAIEAMGLDAPINSPAFGAIVSAIRRGHLRGGHDVGELVAGKMKPLALQTEHPGREISPAPLFSEAVAAYIEHASLAPRSIREVKTCSAEFIYLVGDRRVDALTRRDFVAYVQYRASRIVGAKAKDAVQRPASADTVNKALGFLRSAIRHVIDHVDFSFEGPNPAAAIKIDAYVKKVDKAAMPDKRGFRVGELNKIMTHPWFTGCRSATQIHEPGTHRLIGSEYWVPVIAMFSGARCAELGGLRLAEVLIDDPHPHFVIRDNEYRTTKGGYARCVPIIDALFDLGFATYVNRMRAAGADRLFPDWMPPTSKNSDDNAWYNSRLIKAFNRTVIPARLGADMIAGARREVTFHSFRGAFKAMLGSARYGLHPNIINEVIGHSKSELDERYIGTIAIEDTYAAVRACRHEGLVVTHLPSPLAA